MKRTKRFTIRRVVLGLAVAAVVAPVAQAEPIGSYERQSSAVEIPYLSAGVGVSHMDFDPASQASGKKSDEIAYLSHGAVKPVDFWNYDSSGNKIADTSPGVAPDQLAGLMSGTDVVLGPDDMTLARPSNAGSPAVASTETGFEVGTATISAFGAALFLLIGGSAIALRQSRKTKLSPA
jgi:hypothetical protein